MIGFGFGGGNSAVAALITSNSWTGAIDHDWHKAGNWNTGVVPNTTHSVNIPYNAIGGAGRYPEVSNIKKALANAVNLTIGNCKLNMLEGSKMDVWNGITSGGFVYVDPVASDALSGSIVQTHDGGSLNSGAGFNYNINEPLVKYDAMVFGSPTSQAGQTVAGVTLNDKYEEFYYTDGGNLSVLDQWQETDGSSELRPGAPATGYAPDTADESTKADYQLSHWGVLNDGDVDVTVAVISPTWGGDYHSGWVSNPYASAIDLKDFFYDNQVEEAAIWTHNHPWSGGDWYPYDNSGSPLNFTNFNLFGSVKNTADDVLTDIDFINPTQAMVVPFIPEDDGSGNLTKKFSFKASSMVHKADYQPTERHRIWLNLTSDWGDFSQVLIGYAGGYIDFGYTSRIFSYETELYPIIPTTPAIYALENSTDPYQETAYWSKARSFDTENPAYNDATQAIPIGVTVQNSGITPVNYTISIDNMDGMFANGTIPNVYLYDKFAGGEFDEWGEPVPNPIYWDLVADGPYTFTDTGEFTYQYLTRFEIRFYQF